MSETLIPQESWLTVVSSQSRGGVQRNAESIARFLLDSGRVSHLYSLADSSFLTFRDGMWHECQPADMYNATIVHNHGPAADLVSVISAISTKIVLEYSIWGKPNILSQQADGVLHYSREMLNKYSKRLPKRNPSRPSAIIGAVIQDPFFSLPSTRELGRWRLNVEPDQVLVGRVGQPHTESKWHPGLVEEFRRAAQSDERAVLVLIGPHDSVRRASEESLRPEQLRIVDWVDSDVELVHILDALDVYAHWSAQGETFGISVVEAMARGLPVVSMKVADGDNSQIEFFEMSRSHPTIATRSPRAFRRALRHFMTHPVRAPRGALRERFSVEVVTAGVLRLADEVARVKG